MILILRGVKKDFDCFHYCRNQSWVHSDTAHCTLKKWQLAHSLKSLHKTRTCSPKSQKLNICSAQVQKCPPLVATVVQFHFCWRLR